MIEKKCERDVKALICYVSEDANMVFVEPALYGGRYSFLDVRGFVSSSQAKATGSCA
jgi:hypothetical protein